MAGGANHPPPTFSPGFPGDFLLAFLIKAKALTLCLVDFTLDFLDLLSLVSCYGFYHGKVAFNHHLGNISWNPKHPFINGCFNWMIPKLYIENGCFTKHPFIYIYGCLGFQVLIFTIVSTTLRSNSHISLKQNMVNVTCNLCQEKTWRFRVGIPYVKHVVLGGLGGFSIQFEGSCGIHPWSFLGGGNSLFFVYVHPYYLGVSRSNLTNAHIFQMGWLKPPTFVFCPILLDFRIVFASWKFEGAISQCHVFAQEIADHITLVFQKPPVIPCEDWFFGTPKGLASVGVCGSTHRVFARLGYGVHFTICLSLNHPLII